MKNNTHVEEKICTAQIHNGYPTADYPIDVEGYFGDEPADIPQEEIDEMLRTERDRATSGQSQKDSGEQNGRGNYTTDAKEQQSETQHENAKAEAIRKIIADSKSPIVKLATGTDWKECRHIELETFAAFEAGYLSRFIHPSAPNTMPTPRFIFPLGDANDPPSFNAILSPSGRERFKNSDRWEHKNKCLTAGQKLLCNPSALKEKIVLVAEGEFDAASLWQANHKSKEPLDTGNFDRVGFCALGGAGQFDDLIKRLSTMEVKPKIIILFDKDKDAEGNDGAGIINGRKLKEKLLAMHVLCSIQFFEDVLTVEEIEYIGKKPDANAILCSKGEDFLFWRLNRLVKRAVADFKQLEDEFARAKEYEQEQAGKSPLDDYVPPPARKQSSTAGGNYSDEAKRAAIEKLANDILDTVTVDMLETKGIIRHSDRGKPRPKGYECNFCGSGTKTKKTGVLEFSSSTPTLFYCQACHEGGNVIQFLSKVWNIDNHGKSYFELIQKIADTFGFSYDQSIFEPPHRKRSHKTPPSPLNLSDDNPQSLFSGDTSDDDFAQRMVFMFGNQFHYLQETDEWFTYKSNQHGGGLWKNGGQKNSTLYPFATELAKKLAANAHSKTEQELAERFKSTKKKSTTIAAIKGITDVIITLEDLNTHNNLLNVMNGVVDLETGKLYPADPSLLLTQQTKAIYRAGYRNKIVDGFLKSILPDEETLAGLMRYLGYAATGECSEEKALFCNGGGGNGKGTMTKTLMHLFGDYAATLKTSAVLLMNRSQDAGAATTELNPLINCRVAIVEELPQGGRLDVAKFKNLTGGDMIPMRLLHQEQINVEPHFSPILSGNYLPELSDTRDPGLKRRLLNIVFEQTFTGEARDPNLKTKLSTADALSGLLSIVVTEAVSWYKHGLIISAAMEQATKDYLDENDFIAEFIEENCDRGARLSITRKDFLDRLKNGDYAAECLKQFGNNDRALTSAIKRIEGIEYRRSGRTGGNAFVGIGWKGAPKQSTLDQCTPISPDDCPPF